MEFDLELVKPSKRDISRGIRLPRHLSVELAEFIGIVIGDGHLNVLPSINGNSIRRDVCIAANSLECEYIEFIKRLFSELFNYDLKESRDKKSNSVLLRAHSKGVIEFLVNVCNLPINRKGKTVHVPDLIMKSSTDIKYAFLRGLADTDFSLSFQKKHRSIRYYPVLKGGFASKHLVMDLEILFEELGFRYCTYYNEVRPDARLSSPSIIHTIYLNGKANLEKWIDEIFFSNAKYYGKVDKWVLEGHI